MSEMNNHYLDNPQYPQYSTGTWRNLVTCQEVGHNLGLDHQDENYGNTPMDTCMDYTSPNTVMISMETPNKKDYDCLCSSGMYPLSDVCTEPAEDPVTTLPPPPAEDPVTTLPPPPACDEMGRNQCKTTTGCKWKGRCVSSPRFLLRRNEAPWEDKSSQAFTVAQGRMFPQFGERSSAHPQTETHAVYVQKDPKNSKIVIITHLFLA